MSDYGLVIRRFDSKDLFSVLDIENLSFSEEQRYSVETFVEYFSEHPDCFFVAEVSGRVVGYVICSYIEDFGHIVSIAVHPEFRGRGIGEALLDKAESTLRDRGVRLILLEVAVSNKVALNLYLKKGYVVATTLRGYYGVEDAFLMVKTLK